MRPPRQAQRTKSLHGWRGRMLGPLCEETGVSAVCLLPALDAPLCSSGKCRRLRRRQETQPTRSESSFSERTLFPPALPLRAGSLTCTYAHMHPHTCMHAHIYANPQHTCVHTCSHTRTCIHARAHTHSHTCTHAHAHTCAHTHRGTHAHAWQRSRDREGRGHFVGIFKRRQWPFLTMSPVPHFRALSSVTV